MRSGAKRFASASGAPPGSSFACGGSVELRAWLCAFVRARDALRCVPARRVLKLSRINGFHLYDVLHAQQFLFVLVVNLKKGKVTGITKQDKKGDFAVLTRTCRAACYLHHPGAVPRVTGVIF